MYDLCTRPEQPESAPTHAEMESREEAEAPGRQQQELRGPREQNIMQHRHLDKALPVPTTANITSTSLLGKRHHSLYANLGGFEVEGMRKVSVEHLFTTPGRDSDVYIISMFKAWRKADCVVCVGVC